MADFLYHMRTKHLFILGLPLLIIVTIILAYFSNGKDSIFCTFAVLTGCLAAHLIIWILSAIVVVGIMKNRADDEYTWFRELSWEKDFYRIIKFRKWKRLLPTYDPRYYDFKALKYEDLLGIISQTEIVHEIAAVLSLLSIAGTRWLDHSYIIVTMAIIDLLINLIYVCLQRYNRTRLRRLIRKFND